MYKSIDALLPAQDIDMDGFLVKQAIPTIKVDQIDPFLLLHHAKIKFTNNQLAKHLGIGPHPHRGFSPVTFVVEGEVHHRDSRGHNQIAKKGEVQWMNAGAGIIHSERPSQDFVEQEGVQEIIQLWINLPAAKKMLPPKYHYLSQKNISAFWSEDEKVKTKLVAGNYQAEKGNFETESELLILWSEGRKKGQQRFEIATDFNSCIYVIKGQISVAGYGLIDAENLANLSTEGTEINIEIKEDNTQFIVLAGKPIAEKLAKQGPFVMNSQTEIMEAMRDYQMGKMGVLIED